MDDEILTTSPVGAGDEEAIVAGDDNRNLQVRTMEIPRWLSTAEVTKFLVGNGSKEKLEDEYECTLTISGHGSGTNDPKVPGFHLPHLLITMTGHDVRQLGRLRRALEDALVDYIIEQTPEKEDKRIPPPSLGRLLYSLALSAANASPKTKDRAPNRTVLSRSPSPFYVFTRARSNDRQETRGPPVKKVWMNVMELPQDESTKEYHGRFLAGRNGSLLEYYRTKFECRVDIYGVWGDGGKGGEGEGEDGDGDNGNADEEVLLCSPYVLVTSEDKKSVDRCLQFIEHRIREHEEKFGVSRPGGKRMLRGEMG
mmetsp:Transcript_25461/g.43460  ORF Transcript_25461/g.43460 Transcript_25461/m.43460 type:complete len:311 (+) Transcript_25461:57-989(+)